MSTHNDTTHRSTRDFTIDSAAVFTGIKGIRYDWLQLMAPRDHEFDQLLDDQLLNEATATAVTMELAS